jgi:hypothetical protein
LPGIIHRGRAFFEKHAMSAPDRMVRCRLRPSEKEQARNNIVFALQAGSAEAIEKFLVEYYYF